MGLLGSATKLLAGIPSLDLHVDLMTILVTAASGVAALFLYWLLFVPLNRIKDLTDVGYSHLKDHNKRRGLRLRDLVNESRALRKSGSLPPIYPNGWFALVESRDLKKGGVLAISALGENFAVFRGEEGAAHVLDAYCPHLGAHLAVGGQVVGNCIECPFHGWRFNGKNGQCVHIPYAEKVPSFAKVKKWPSWEGNGYVFVWYHAEKEEPTWQPPEKPEINTGEWVYSGRTEHYVNAHIQEVPENGGDVNHLPQLHSPALMAGVDLRFLRTQLWEFAQHVWEATWKESEPPNTHIATMTVKHSMRFFGKIPLFNMEVLAKQIGPGVVHLEFETTFGKGILVQTICPVGPLLLKIVHQFYTERSMPSFYSKIVLLGEAIMIERDITIWNHKTYMHKPLLVKEDRLLAQHRRWYSQFYSENSPRLAFAKDTSEW